MLPDDRIAHSLVDEPVAAMKSHIATDRVPTVVDEQLALQPG